MRLFACAMTLLFAVSGAWASVHVPTTQCPTDMNEERVMDSTLAVIDRGQVGMLLDRLFVSRSALDKPMSWGPLPYPSQLTMTYGEGEGAGGAWPVEIDQAHADWRPGWTVWLSEEAFVHIEKGVRGNWIVSTGAATRTVVSTVTVEKTVEKTVYRDRKVAVPEGHDVHVPMVQTQFVYAPARQGYIPSGGIDQGAIGGIQMATGWKVRGGWHAWATAGVAFYRQPCQPSKPRKPGPCPPDGTPPDSPGPGQVGGGDPGNPSGPGQGGKPGGYEPQPSPGSGYHPGLPGNGGPGTNPSPGGIIPGQKGGEPTPGGGTGGAYPAP